MPAFVTFMVEVTISPTATGEGEADFVMDSAADARVRTTAVEWLFSELGSGVELETEATLEMV